MLNYFVLFLSFTGVRSAQTKLSVMDIMKSDPQLCPTSKFLYDSEYTKLCASIAYPTGISSWNYNLETLNSFLCLGVNDTAYKICQYSSQLQNLNYSTATFNSYVEKYVPNKNEDQEVFCNSLQGFTSLYNKSDSLWGQLVESLNKPHKCVRICFDFQDKFHPLCAVFAWIKSIDDNIKSAKKIETKQDSADKSRISQPKDEITSDIKTIPTESKKTSEANESKEQNKKQITADSNINNNDKEGDVPGNIPLAKSDVKPDGEKTKSDTEKTSNIQKKKNNTLEISAHKSVPSTFKENKENIINTELGTNAEVAKPIKDIPPNSDSQAPSNNALNNINKKVVNEKNTEKSNKEQDIDDFKTSTLSENTQDHYDGNPDENIENDIDGITYKYAFIMYIVVNVYKCVFVHMSNFKNMKIILNKSNKNKLES